MQALGHQLEVTGTVDSDLYQVIQPLVVLRGSDIMTYTNIASSHQIDKFITVAAARRRGSPIMRPGNLVHKFPCC